MSRGRKTRSTAAAARGPARAPATPGQEAFAGAAAGVIVATGLAWVAGLAAVHIDLTATERVLLMAATVMAGAVVSAGRAARRIRRGQPGGPAGETQIVTRRRLREVLPSAAGQYEAPALAEAPSGENRSARRARVRVPRNLGLPAALAGVFAALTALVAPGGRSGPAWAVDWAVSQHAARLAAAHPQITSTARAVTELGDWRIAAPVLGICAGLSAWRGRSVVPALRGALAAGALAGLVLPFKWVITRPVPPADVPGTLGVFPSGHTAATAICYGTALCLLASGAARPLLRAAARVLAAVVTLAVSAALVWCRYHWLTDVVASWALSGLVLWAVFTAPRLTRPWVTGLRITAIRSALLPATVFRGGRR